MKENSAVREKWTKPAPSSKCSLSVGPFESEHSAACSLRMPTARWMMISALHHVSGALAVLNHDAAIDGCCLDLWSATAQTKHPTPVVPRPLAIFTNVSLANN